MFCNNFNKIGQKDIFSSKSKKGRKMANWQTVAKKAKWQPCFRADPWRKKMNKTVNRIFRKKQRIKVQN
jgi:hypothetical protein